MTYHSDDIAALIGSRICHDLISPIGAVTNGLELMALSGDGAEGPEAALVSESAAQASARVRFFRLAFGAAAADQTVGANEIRGILANLHAGGRSEVAWQSQESLARSTVRAVLLALLCAEQALPRGGRLSARQDAAGWTVTGRGRHVEVRPDLWASLSGQPAPAGIAPSEVQFLLLPELLASLGKSCRCTTSDPEVTISF